MKKEIIAGAVLVLILAVSLFNISFINKKTDALAAQINEAAELSAQGETARAEAVLQASLEDWKRMDDYVHILLRHDAIDPITSEYYTVLEELQKGEATPASFENLLENLEKLAEMERLSWSSVF